MTILLARFGRFIAAFVTLTMLSSSIAMAGYVCPKAERQAAMLAALMADRAMADSATADTAHHAQAHASGLHHASDAGNSGDAGDSSNEHAAKTPCVQQHAGNKQALEQAEATPVPALPAVVSMQPLMPAAPAWQRLANAAAPHDYPSHAPPFLRTLRLRI